MCNSKTKSENCITEILSVINILQRNACPDTCLDSCDKPVLGGGSSCLVCNTRPVMIYTCCGNGVPFSMPVCKDITTACSNPGEVNPSMECSSVFRVEKIEGNCATFRVLKPNTEECSDKKARTPFIGTNSFFTFDLNCACAVKCLSDTYVDCI